MSREIKTEVTSEANPTRSWQGTLLGVTVDLSGSMQRNLKNDQSGQYSRIESLSRSFQHAIEDIEKLLENGSTNDEMRLRLFLYGFGVLDCGQPICDILASIDHLDEKIERYRRLKPELEQNWLFEVNRILEEKRIPGDAKENLRQFVESELRNKAIAAERKRSLVKLQLWCENTSFKLDQYESRLRSQLDSSRYFFILIPIVASLIWLLRLPALTIVHFHSIIENWVQSRLTDIHTNAEKYATKLANRVVTQTEKTIHASQQEINITIINGMVEFIDHQAFHLIQLYNQRSSVTRRRNELNWNEFQLVYKQVARKIENIIRPHANQAWKKNVFILRQAARVLRMTPNWDTLQLKTVECAQQAVWMKIEPSVHLMAEEVAKQRFTRAVIATLINSADKKEATLSIEDLPKLVESCRESKISMNELPIFGRSPLGEALFRVHNQFKKEVSLPKNKHLRPVLLIVSDGQPNGRADPLFEAERLKESGVTVICCYVTNKNLGHSWVLRERPRWRWPKDAKLMFSMASHVDEWPEFGERLKNSRFQIKRHAKLFVQINHSEYLENFINAVLLPLEREHQFMKMQAGKERIKSS